jgi:prepilin-type N-terminal cleavage/methylation domain-containing protein
MHIKGTTVKKRETNMPLVLHRGKDRRAGTAGFTLVELVVVVVMMGVLAALLLPALSTAKEKSRRAVCQSNIHQLLMVLDYFANDHEDHLPSALDNMGKYHSIRLSDETFTNLVELAGGQSNIFYCPNIVFGTASNNVLQHDVDGYVIGYSYLANGVQTTSKGDATWVYPTKLTDSPTNELIADANFWTTQSAAGGFPAGMTIAPHRPMGAAMARGSSFTFGLNAPSDSPQKPPSVSAGIGAVGGNIGFLNWSVTWRNINQMQTYSASSLPEEYGNW